jgi:hypothetical protein
MTILSRFEKRLRDLEGVNPANGIVLHFADGSTRFFRIHKKSVLRVFCESTRLSNWSEYPEQFTPEKLAERRARKDVTPGAFDDEDPITGKPVLKFEKFLLLLGHAVRISGPGAEGLVQWAWANCRFRLETLRRGEKFYFSQGTTDPFFLNNCEVGPLTGNEPEQLPQSAVMESDGKPEVLADDHR